MWCTAGFYHFLQFCLLCSVYIDIHMYVLYIICNVFQSEGVETESLGRHPLLSLDGAGTALVKLRRQFHCFLQAVSELMPKVLY